MSLVDLIRKLSDKAKSCVRDLDPQNDLTFLRIRTKKQEILIAPGKNNGKFLIVDFFSRKRKTICFFSSSFSDKDYLTIVLQAHESA